jgi:HEAT repeat protein
MLLAKLAGGDRRSIGRSGEVAAEVLADPSLFPALFAGMLDADPLIRMRAADAVEKVTAAHSEYLRPYKDELLHQAALSMQQEMRWHVAQLIPRLELSADERVEAVDILNEYLSDKSRIVQAFALQALADLATDDESLRPQVITRIEKLMQSGSPAVQSRARRLSNAIERDDHAR